MAYSFNHKRKKVGIYWLLALLCFMFSVYATYAIKFNNINFQPTYQSQKVAKYQEPSIDLGPYPASIRLYGQDYEYHNSDDPLPMASTVKLVTALSLIDKIGKDNLNNTITLTAQDTTITQDYINIGGSVARFNKGYKLTYEEALEYLLVISANNFADILVNRQFANQQDYLKYANDWLDKNGLKNTKVYDASGFDPRTIATPSDLSALGALAIKNPSISKIVEKKSVTLPSGLIKSSTNLFLDSNYGTTAGIKTGNTDEAKFVFVTSIESEDKPTIISSVMQAPNRTVSQRQAIDNADALGKTYNEQEIFTENAPVLSTNLPWQKNVTIYTKEPVIIANIANKTIKYSLQIDNFTKNTKAGQKIGLLTAQSLIEQKSYDLYLSDDYHGVSPFWLLTNPLY